MIARIQVADQLPRLTAQRLDTIGLTVVLAAPLKTLRLPVQFIVDFFDLRGIIPSKQGNTNGKKR